MATLEANIVVQETQRHLFHRMIDAGLNHEVCMKTMSFWMWLESQGFKDIFGKISSRNDNGDKYLVYLSDEAMTVLESLKPNSTIPTSKDLMPITSTLAPVLFNVEAMFVNKEENGEETLKVIEELYSNHFTMLFEDILEEKGIKVNGSRREKSEEVAKVIKEWTELNEGGTTQEGRDSVAINAAPLDGSRLDPFAREWHPNDHISDDDRCLFLTFSNGFPLTEDQIRFFFQRKFGPCVERVYVHQQGDEHPLFGKIMFRWTHVPAMILRGRRQSRFMVNGRPLWCKKFESRRTTVRGGVTSTNS